MLQSGECVFRDGRKYVQNISGCSNFMLKLNFFQMLVHYLSHSNIILAKYVADL